MKVSTKLLSIVLLLLVSGLLYSNIKMKSEFNRFDKSDTYWTYGRILEQPFKYLKIDGGNLSMIAFEPSPSYSVRVLREWSGFKQKRVKAYVKSDTLFIDFPKTPIDLYEKFWMPRMTLVRIFAPELLSVEGFDTNLGMFKMKQKNMTVHISGKSKFELESLLRGLDSLKISQSDSSMVVFEMSPDYKADTSQKAGDKVVVTEASHPGLVVNMAPREIITNDAMSIKYVDANLRGYTLLDLGHAQIGSLNLAIADSSAIILSGGSLHAIKK